MRLYTGGEVRLIEDVLPGIGPDTKADDLRIVVDRLRVNDDEETPTRIRDSVARAFSYGGGVCETVTDDGLRAFSSRFEADGIEFEPPTEHLFSFNNPLGACPPLRRVREGHRHRRGPRHPRQEQNHLRGCHRLLARRDHASLETAAHRQRRKVRLSDPHPLSRADPRPETPALAREPVFPTVSTNSSSTSTPSGARSSSA